MTELTDDERTELASAWGEPSPERLYAVVTEMVSAHRAEAVTMADLEGEQ